MEIENLKTLFLSINKINYLFNQSKKSEYGKTNIQ